MSRDVSGRESSIVQGEDVAFAEDEHSVPALKPVRPAIRAALVALGSLALALGVLGLILPILPTTPFLLLAAGCYVRASERLYEWLIHHPRLGLIIRRYVAQRAVPLQIKILSLIVAWAVLLGMAIFVVDRLWLKGLLVALAVVKTVFMTRVKTSQARPGEKERNANG